MPFAPQPVVYAPLACVVDTLGNVVWGRSETTRNGMASTTKLMTGLLACELLGDSLGSTTITITSSHTLGSAFVPAGSTVADLRVGDTVTVNGLLYGMMYPSGNDAAVAVADAVGAVLTGGSNSATNINAFIARMNTRATQLGLVNTHFVNPNGVANPSHYTSARDLAYLCLLAYQNRFFAQVGLRNAWREIASNTGWAYIWSGGFYLQGLIAGCFGTKGGSWDSSSVTIRSLASTVQRSGVTIGIAVIQDYVSDQIERLNDHHELTNYAFRRVGVYDSVSDIVRFSNARLNYAGDAWPFTAISDTLYTDIYARQSNVVGASVDLSPFFADSIAWRGVLAGAADVYVDGRLDATVSVAGSGGSFPAQLLYQKSWTKTGQHAVRIVVRSGTVLHDSFVITDSADPQGLEMPNIYYNRVIEESSNQPATSGTQTINLSGTSPTAAFIGGGSSAGRTFANKFANAQTCAVHIYEKSNPSRWITVDATFNTGSPNTLTYATSAIKDGSGGAAASPSWAGVVVASNELVGDGVYLAALQGRSHLEGMIPTYNSNTVIDITAGTAAVNGKVLTLAATSYTSASTMKDLAGSTYTLAASKIVLIYLYDNAGTAEIRFQEVTGSGDGVAAAFNTDYDYYAAPSSGVIARRIGVFWTNGSSQIIRFKMARRGRTRKFDITRQGNGLGTSLTQTGYTSVSLYSTVVTGDMEEARIALRVITTSGTNLAVEIFVSTDSGSTDAAIWQTIHTGTFATPINTPFELANTGTLHYKVAGTNASGAIDFLGASVYA